MGFLNWPGSCFAVRQGPRTTARQRRVDFMVIKQLAWIQGIRRAVLDQHNRSPVPGSVTLLAPHYTDGIEKMYSDMAAVIRYVRPDPIEEDPESSK